MGEFEATDPDVNSTLAFYLVNGAEEDGTPVFSMETNGTLRTAKIFDFENEPTTYAIQVRLWTNTMLL